MTDHGRSAAVAASGLRPSGAEPQDASQAKPLVPNAEFYKELRSILADCSDFLGDTTLGDRCEAMLAQVVADEPERLAEVTDLRTALVDHNDALRSAAQVAGRDGKGTNWLTFRGSIHWVLAEHHEITNEARAASRIDARRGETGTGSIGTADESLTLEEGDAQ